MKERKPAGHPEYALIAYLQKENAALRDALQKWLGHAEMNPRTFKDRLGSWVPLVKQTRAALGSEADGDHR